MEAFQTIAAQTVAEAKENIAIWTEDALICHDKEVSSSTKVEVETMRQYKRNWVDKIKEAMRIEKLDTCDLHDLPWSYRHLSPENKWKKEIILTLYFRYYKHGRKVPYNVFGDMVEESWYDEAPESIQHDSDVLLCHLTTKEWRFRKTRKTRTKATYKFLVDDDMTPTFFRHFPTHLLREKRKFLVDDDMTPTFFRHFPTHLLREKRIVVAAVKVFPEILMNPNLPPHWLADKDVFLEFTKVEPIKRGEYKLDQLQPWVDQRFRHLVTRFSKDIRTNSELMVILVRKCCFCIDYVEESVKGYYPNIILAAKESAECYSDIVLAVLSMKYADDNSDEQSLPSVENETGCHSKWDKSLLLRLFQNGARHNVKPFYTRALPASLQGDRDILEVVLRGECVNPNEIPSVVARDRDFWSLVNSCSNYRQYVPLELQSDPEFAARGWHEDDQYLRDFFAENPVLKEDPAFWTFVIQNESISGNYHLHGLIQDNATASIRQNRDLMLLACKDPHVYGILDERLRSDMDFIEAAASDDYYHIDKIFPFVPERVKSTHPDLTLHFIGGCDHRAEAHEIPDDLWSNLEVVKAFVESRQVTGEETIDETLWLLPGFPDRHALKDDDEFALFVAKKCDCVSEFVATTSLSRRRSKAFMLKAVTVNPICLGGADGTIKEDFDLAVKAFSREIYNWHDLFGWDIDDQAGNRNAKREFLCSNSATAREKLLMFDGFWQGFLPGLTVKPTSCPDCVLPLLLRGEDTTEGITTMIADFAGVPDAEQLDDLRAVSLNLLHMCIQEEET